MTEITTINSNNENIKNIKKYTINSNNKEFKIQLGILTNIKKIIFNIEESSQINDYDYISDFSLDELKTINKIFKIYDTIDETYNELNELFINQRVSIQYEIQDINLIFSVSNFSSSKTENISLKIKKHILNKEKMNELIFKEINKMKEDFMKNKKDLENKINLLQEDLKKEKQKNENLEKHIEELKRTIKQLSEWKEMKEKYYINSRIIDDIEDVKLLHDRLTNKGIFKDKNIKFNLIYRASRDGDSPKIYQTKCQGKNNLLYVIQTKKGWKLGGYSEVKADFQNKHILDLSAFIFSLTLKKIYDYLESNSSVTFKEGYGPMFDWGFFVGNNNFFDDNLNTSIAKKSDSRFYYMDSDFEINNGEPNFLINELEVFQIILIN